IIYTYNKTLNNVLCMAPCDSFVPRHDEAQKVHYCYSILRHREARGDLKTSSKAILSFILIIKRLIMCFA
ncbi:hypothetical protein, partial [Saccharicrinis aurantiacus]|uniref:hypothetical protein n=1 Tax=Saccharicrinis aurantiacus TaxID=1849719 RepID=UPI0024918A31